MNDTYDYGVTTNIAHICGEVIDGPKLSHKTYGESFSIFKVGVKRNSGYEDQIQIMASDRSLPPDDIKPGMFFDIQGQVRTYNEEVEGKNRLNIVVFARDFSDGIFFDNAVNDIYLEGYLCKTPITRTSPMGRRICDLMLAVNRMYNKSDYVPCIAWGRNAAYAGTLHVGDKIAIHGRLQSREYTKLTENGSEERTAYEISALTAEILLEEF